MLRGNMEFFESTPIGRIVNRFSKDIESTEKQIPEAFRNITKYAMNILSALMVISINTPLFLVAIVPLSAAYYLVEVSFLWKLAWKRSSYRALLSI